jgi:hypothetical protein
VIQFVGDGEEYRVSLPCFPNEMHSTMKPKLALRRRAVGQLIVFTCEVPYRPDVTFQVESTGPIRRQHVE